MATPTLHPHHPSCRGTAALEPLSLFGVLSLGLVALQDWYVDVNAPGCPTGTGTQADPFCDIMDAVVAASDGDTIHIAPGTYFENVVLDKDLSLIGTGGEQFTILDGHASGSVVRVDDSRITLRGLTLTNGSGTLHCEHNGGCWYRGGGIAAAAPFYDATVTLEECTVIGNSAAQGSGIWLNGGALAILDSTVSNNATSPNVLYTSAAIIAYIGSIDLINSAVYANTNSDPQSSIGLAMGSGMTNIEGSSISGHTLSNIHCSSLTMTDSSVSGGSYGIRIFDGTSLITNSTVSGCSTAGILFRGYGSTLTLANSTVSGNATDGILVDGYYPTTMVLTNSTVTDNGTGIHLVSVGPQPYVYVSSYARATISNSILWSNGASLALEGPDSSATADYSLVEGGWPGVGNTSADPHFVDPLNGDFHLMSGSPCIDAGNNLAVPPGIFTDLDGKFRFIDDPLTPDTGHPGHLWPIVDMGAYEFGVELPRKVRRR